jgi:hypothetical protein
MVKPATDMAGAVENLFAALGVDEDAEMTALMAAFSESSRAFDAAAAAYVRGDIAEFRRLSAAANELAERHKLLSTAYRHKLSGAATH